MKRYTALALIACACALTALAFAEGRRGDVLLYNHSPSLPVGLYQRIDVSPALASIVTVRAGDVAQSEAHAHQFDGPATDSSNVSSHA